MDNILPFGSMLKNSLCLGIALRTTVLKIIVFALILYVLIEFWIFSGTVGLKIMIEKCMKHMKEGLCMTYSTRPILLVFGEEPVKIFTNEKLAANKPDLYHLLQDVLGRTLATKNGEKWKEERKMLTPAFSFGMLKDKVPLFNEHALAFVKDLEILVGKPSIDLLDVIKNHYFNALSESVFGLKQTEENRDENLKYFRGLDNLCTSIVYRLSHPWLYWRFMLATTSYGQKILRVREETFSFTKNIIFKMKQHITSNQTSDPECFSKNLRKSITYILLQHHLNDPSFTFEELQGAVSGLMFAGHDTTSYTTMWCLYMLGLYPEVQEKAYNEVAFASVKNYISYENCSKFAYLKAVILETMRLYPSIPLFGRQLSEDIQYGERIVPKDTIIAFFTYVMHRNPDMYPDPENFDPERFLGSNKINSWTYMPFSEGQRDCIGRKYALTEMKIFLAHFLRNYKITSLDRREDIRLCWNLILSPEKPLRMHIERR